ncbi:MAG: ECF transporter S component [Ruminococcus sp.]|jgi:diguanylate cyclase (GGDEF)-like protein
MFESLGKSKENKRLNKYLLWGLIAVELLMSFSFLGYIHIEPISITIVYIPVLLAGCFSGVWEATIVGAVFGAASMWKASAFYISVGDALFSPLMSGKPIHSIILSVGTRALFGFVTGILYWAVKKSRHPLAGILLVTGLGRILHSILVYGFMGILFPEAGFGIADAFSGLFKSENILLLVVQELLILLCLVIQNSEFARKFGERIKMADRIAVGASAGRKVMVLVILVTFVASFSVAWYFINRIEKVMAWHGVILSDQMSYDIVHIQVQFLFGIIALFAIVILGVVLGLKNFNYLYYYEAKLDGLTGIFSRDQFFLLGEKMLGNMKIRQEGRAGCFIIIDVDHFKQINDQYGHPTGDRVLSEVADKLKYIFGDLGIVGRLGGDEFVVLIDQLVNESEVTELMDSFKEEMGKINVMGTPVSCSVGVVPVEEHSVIEDLYRSADLLLYKAKKEKGFTVYKKQL